MSAISTVHIDRHGYVVEQFCNARKATLDARKYPGTLMEVEGPVCVGWHWDGQKFALPPPRVPADAVRAERDRRVDGPFPERFRAQITALGGDNALKVSRYVSECIRVAESMMDDAPRDYRDDRHWPRAPELIDLPVPQRAVETARPVNVTIAPVINAQPVEARPVPLEIVHRTVSDSVSTVSEGEFGLDTRDPLYALKVAMFRTIEDTVQRIGPGLPEDVREAWEDQLAEIAAIATAATSEDQIAAQGERVAAFIEGKAA